jgi:hypothetical protein
VAIYDRTLGPDAEQLRDAVFNLGMTELALRRPERAIPVLERAAGLGPDGPPVLKAWVDSALDRALYEPGRDRAGAWRPHGAPARRWLG